MNQLITTNYKIKIIATWLMIGMTVICARLFYLQIHLTQYLFDKGQRNFLRVKRIESPRGDIIDIHGRLLATNRPIVQLYWQGTGNKKLTTQHHHMIEQIETIIEKKIHDNTELISHITNAERQSKKALIVSDITFEQLSKISELFANTPNIYIDKQFERYYPHDTLASHIVGYLGHMDIDTIGKMGIEHKFDTNLKGKCGSVVTTINSLGTPLAQQQILPAHTGQPIQTTLDLELQQIAENAFFPDQAGTLIVMDPEKGDIRALVSRPNFDPGLFLKPISTEHWRELQEKRPFLNRAFNACYPPASIFKLVSIAAALETNIITPESLVRCTGYVTFGNRKYRCARRYEGHGVLGIMESIAQSCNILFYEIGKRIDIDALSTYARHFGLGEKTGIIFQEKEGIMPTRAWKKAVIGQPWWPGDTLQATIGQSYLLVTPIQIARMISSIFTGFLVSPRIVTSEPIVSKPLNIRPETLSFLRESMNVVVMSGTGKQLRSLAYEDFELYAKTGTAQTSELSKRNLGGAHLEHAWSVVYFRYRNERPLTIVVLIEHAGTSRPAKMCAKRFLSGLRTLRMQKVKPEKHSKQP